MRRSGEWVSGSGVGVRDISRGDSPIVFTTQQASSVRARGRTRFTYTRPCPTLGTYGTRHSPHHRIRMLHATPLTAPRSDLLLTAIPPRRRVPPRRGLAPPIAKSVAAPLLPLRPVDLRARVAAGALHHGRDGEHRAGQRERALGASREFGSGERVAVLDGVVEIDRS